MRETNGKAVHSLIIPGFRYRAEGMPGAAALAMCRANGCGGTGQRTGMLLTGLLPFRDALKPNRYGIPSVEEEGNMTVVRNFRRAKIPLRFISPGEKAAYACMLGLEAYDAYFETCGRPDAVYACGCLYAGLLAKRLSEAYGLPYAVAESRPLRRGGAWTGPMAGAVREVLLGASALALAGMELYGQYIAEFGDIDVVRKAVVLPV